MIENYHIWQEVHYYAEVLFRHPLHWLCFVTQYQKENSKIK